MHEFPRVGGPLLVLCGWIQCTVDRRVREQKKRKREKKKKNEHEGGRPQDWALAPCMQPLNRDLYRRSQEERAGQLVMGNGWQWAVGSEIDIGHDERPECSRCGQRPGQAEVHNARGCGCVCVYVYACMRAWASER